MLRRGLALSLVLAMGSIVQAGAVVTLVPSASTNPFNPCGSYSTGEEVTVEIFLSQVGSLGDHYLRMVQLDFSASHALISAPSTIAWTAVVNHFAHTDGALLSNTFHGDLLAPDLEIDTVEQTLLDEAGTPVKVGEMTITMPSSAGSFLLDVLNSGNTDPDQGAQVRYGFGLVGLEDITIWRGLDLEDGQATFDVVDQALIVSAPDDQGSLWRSEKNIIRLTFDRNIAVIAGPIILQGFLEISAMAPGGTFTPNLNPTTGSPFTFDVEDDGGGNPRILRIQDSGANMTHRTWYALRNTGAWGAVGQFVVQHKVLIGDVNGDGLLLSNDAGLINLDIPCFFACNPAVDVNGDGLILSNDVGLANLGIPVFFVAKPTGHDCP